MKIKKVLVLFALMMSVCMIPDTVNAKQQYEENTTKCYVAVAQKALRVREDTDQKSKFVTIYKKGSIVEIQNVIKQNNEVWGEVEKGYICLEEEDTKFAEILKFDDKESALMYELKDSAKNKDEKIAVCIKEKKQDIPLIPFDSVDINEKKTDDASDTVQTMVPLSYTEEILSEPEIKAPEKIEPEASEEKEEIEELVSEVIDVNEEVNVSELYDEIYNYEEPVYEEPTIETKEEEIIEDEYNPADFTVERNSYEVTLLAKLMEHEAGGEGEDGITAVAEVVRNRVKSDLFPNDVYSVIFQSGQFENVEHIIDIVPRDEVVSIAERILNGEEGVLKNPDILFFRNAGGSTEDWGKYKFEFSINHHQFYSYSAQE